MPENFFDEESHSIRELLECNIPTTRVDKKSIKWPEWKKPNLVQRIVLVILEQLPETKIN